MSEAYNSDNMVVTLQEGMYVVLNGYAGIIGSFQNNNITIIRKGILKMNVEEAVKGKYVYYDALTGKYTTNGAGRPLGIVIDVNGDGVNVDVDLTGPFSNETHPISAKSNKPNWVSKFISFWMSPA